MNFVRVSPHPDTGLRTPTHVPALDGVRGLAIAVVLLLHSGFLPGGNIGVDLFFVLSGYLITSILLREQMKSGAINLLHFYARRALRLFPALAIMVCCVVAYVAFFSPRQIGMTLIDAGSILLYFFNLRLVGQMPDISQHQWMFSHVWSLSVEEQFYLIWPILLVALHKIQAGKYAVPIIALCGIVYSGTGRWVLWSDGPGLDIYFRTDLRIDGLMFGALVAWLTQSGSIPAPVFKGALGIIGTVAAVCFLALAAYPIFLNGFGYRGGFSLANLLAAIIIATIVWYPPRVLEWAFSMRWLTWLGQISYGVYLWHWPVFRVMEGVHVGPWSRTVIEIALSILIATMSFYGAERHFLKLKRRFSGHHHVSSTPGI